MQLVKNAFIACSMLLLLAGCTKKAIIGNCDEGDYENFVQHYPEQVVIDSLKGNGSFEVWRDEMNYTGNFSLFCYDVSNSWGIDFYGFFGMLLSSVRINGDSFSVASPFLDKPMKGLVHHFDTEAYIGIPLDAYSIQMLTSGRVPFDASAKPSACMKKNGVLSISYDINNLENAIVWSPPKKQVRQFISRRKDGSEQLEVAFGNYRNASEKMVPHTITFTYRGREEAYLKLDYKYIEVK